VSSGIPDDVERLVTSQIDSVEKLEILLLIHGDRRRPWSADLVASELRRNPMSVGRCLDQLVGSGLLGGSSADGYHFAAREPALGRQVAALAQTYSTRRVAVIQLIASNPMDSVTTFADAFRLRRDD
jgi:hypothetical protein